MNKQRGFTLIELLIAITILAILTAVGMTSFNSANQKARDSRREADMQQLRSALEMYRTDNDSYPTVNPLADSSFFNKYLGGKTLADPKNGTYTYRACTSSTPGITSDCTACGTAPCYGYQVTYTLENGGAKKVSNP